MSSRGLNVSFLSLESRRYIGNKAKLKNWILETILAETRNCTSFLDIFAGTASIAKASFQHFKKVQINDILHSNYAIYKAFFEASKWDLKKIETLVSQYNALDPENLPENYFSKNFGNKFFDCSIV